MILQRNSLQYEMRRRNSSAESPIQNSTEEQTRKATMDMQEKLKLLQNAQSYMGILKHMHGRTREINVNVLCKGREVLKELEKMQSKRAAVALDLKDATNNLNTFKRESIVEVEALEIILADAAVELEHACNMLADAKEVEREREIETKRENEIAAEVMGDLTAEGEHRLQKKLVTNKFVHEKLNKDMDDTTNEVLEYTRAFEKIMDATGIANPLDVVDKYDSQLKTRNNLEKMISDMSEKLDKVKARRDLIMSESEEIKYAGIVNKHRACIDVAEKNLHELRRELHKANVQYSKTENLIAKIVHGAQTLMRKVDRVPNSMLPVGDAASQDAFSSTALGRVGVSRDSLVPSLSYCVSRIRRLADALPNSKREIDEQGLDVILNHFFSPSNVKVQQRNVRRNSVSVHLERIPSKRSVKSSDGLSDDEGADANVVLGGADARLRLKAENRRLIQFAEKKRKKLTRLMQKSLTERELDPTGENLMNTIIGSHDPHKALELHVRRLTIQEAKQRKSILQKPKLSSPQLSEKLAQSQDMANATSKKIDRYDPHSFPGKRTRRRTSRAQLSTSHHEKRRSSLSGNA